MHYEARIADAVDALQSEKNYCDDVVGAANVTKTWLPLCSTPATRTARRGMRYYGCATLSAAHARQQHALHPQHVLHPQHALRVGEAS